MGMTIDDAIKILSYKERDSVMGCCASYEDIDNALGVAIDTMRKYEKIEQIMRQATTPWGVIQDTWLYKEIREVVEDGKID